ncbi:MAG: biotin synthase BioB [Alphaproteobacteria bacterium]|nr:biotin synthase BioB [Alphaproteobacteria bacterium]
MLWNQKSVAELFEKPFFDLLKQAHSVHRKNFNPNQIELCALINIKTGGCPEDCGFCNQSAHFKTDLKKEPLMPLEEVIEKAKKLKDMGVQRCCLGAAWRTPPKKEFPRILEMVTKIKKLGFETCFTLGFLDKNQAEQLKKAGLDYYNHNIETSPEFYKSIVSTHTFQDRIDTVEIVGKANIKVCCGGLFGMGETREDRIHFFLSLISLKHPPESIPINRMIRFSKTPLQNVNVLPMFEYIRTVAVARILFPKSRVRLAGGRIELSESDQALCFYAGANSIHVGDILLTSQNKSYEADLSLMKELGIQPIQPGYQLAS